MTPGDARALQLVPGVARLGLPGHARRVVLLQIVAARPGNRCLRPRVRVGLQP